MNRLSCDALVIGAGVVGLSAARSLPSTWNRILVEANPSFGQETSSRNSEVVHSGIYYPSDSAKTRWCIEGRRQLYDYCQGHGVPCKKTGKLLVAATQDETEALEVRVRHALALEVSAELWSAQRARQREPQVQCHAAAFFPESGIVDSHSLMASFERDFLASGGAVAYGHRVESLELRTGAWNAVIAHGSDRFEIEARVVVNAAGLAAARLSNLALSTQRYRHGLCRGRYLGLSARWTGRFAGLVYPLPAKDGLGIHVTVDMSGAARLGPDVEWCAADTKQGLYHCDWESIRDPFHQAASHYLPDLLAADLQPGLVGVRPKLWVDEKPHGDFLVEAHQGFVHCLGIESPGLTAALPLGAQVASLALDAMG